VGTKLLNIEAGGRQRIDRYELIAEIASGGMATVYLARLTGVGGFQRFFAIKRLHPHLAGEKEFVEMFLDEARLAAGIHHPNVVPILEVGASPNGYYLVMEYIEGETLARLLARAAARSSRLPAPVAMRSGVDMLHGLHAAHELRDETGQLVGLVHRDVSPQNVLVGSDGITRITDFGVARAASRLTATRVGQLKGKLAYMAPEQAAGVEALDRRADVFACGIVLWESLAQKRLFKAENEAATLSRVMNEPIPALMQAAPQLPAAIGRVVMKALEREPDRRFATCAEFADALEAAGHGAGCLATPRDMQTYMNEVLGEEIQQQREAVRAWIAKSESISRSDPLLGSSSVSSASMALPGSDVTGSGATHVGQKGGSRTGRVLGFLLLAMLGAVGFLAYKAYLVAPGASPATGVSAATAGTEPEVVELDPPVAPRAPDTENAANPDPQAGTEEPTTAEAPTAQPSDTTPTRSTPGKRPARSEPKEQTAPTPPAEVKPAETKPKTEPPPKKKDPFDGLNQNPYR
jgi:serine/threonine-protein kinase